MKPFSYHAHTLFGDGKNTAEEMVLAAIETGCDSFGLSEHFKCTIPCDYAMSEEDESKYFAELKALKEAYKEKISIFSGIEADLMSPPPKGFDYVIGSVHYFGLDGEYIDVDESAEKQIYAAKKYFGGDMAALGCSYFDSVSCIGDSFKIDIVGHFDLFSKFNEGMCLFDENDSRYKKAGEKAIEALVRKKAVFEINSGAMSRGYRTAPYPSEYFLNVIRELGGDVTFSSDSHSKDSIIYGFEHAVELARRVGFKSFKKLGKNGFYDEEF